MKLRKSIDATVLVAFAAVFSCQAQPSHGPVDLGRAGAVQVGEALSQLQARGTWRAAGASGDPQVCERYAGTLLPVDVWMMVEKGYVTRFDLGNHASQGPFGIRIGDQETDALRKLPSGTAVTQHFYGDEGDHYLTWREPGSDLAVRVETIKGKVQAMYWGKWKSVQYVEGCL